MAVDVTDRPGGFSEREIADLSAVYNPPITTEILCGISREQGWRPSTIVNSAPSQLEIEQVIDRLLRECFTCKSPRE
jgi:hypothetical protein